MTPNDSSWEAGAAELLDSFAASYGAAIERHRLTDLLTRFRVVPKGDEAAHVTVYVAADQLIVEAGRGTRFELDPLPDSREELLAILNGIARGGLREEIGRLGVKFQLALQSGETRSGRVVRRTGSKRGVARYGPY
jgi:hypothetical protein